MLGVAAPTDAPRAHDLTDAPRAHDLTDAPGTRSLVCTAVTDVTHDVRTFSFAPVQEWSGFSPGQHLTLHVPVAGEALRRCYTISSSPTRPDRLEITVKRVPGGVVSGWLHDHLSVGDRVDADGPSGRFSTTHHPARKYLFLSAGSGITPLMSMTRARCDTADGAGGTDVAFVHHARTPADIIFRRELEEVAARHPGVSVTVVCEGSSAGERWTGRRGLVDAATLRAVVPDAAQREVFTCGPPGYRAAARAALAEVGVDPDRCHEESFDVVAGRGSPTGGGTVDPGAAAGFAVELRRSGTVLRCGPDQTVLDAVLAAGRTVPSSCGEGLCGTCVTTVVDGTVDMVHQGGIRPREVAQRKILLCCSTPLSDLVLDA